MTTPSWYLETRETVDAPPRLGFRGWAGHAELRDTGTATETMAGHLAVFNQWTEINSEFEGHFMERIAPGAFKKTIRERGDRVQVLFQHGQDPAIGNKVLGRVRDLREDSHGVPFEVDLFTDAGYVRDLLPGLRAGAYGSSFRFRTIREDFTQYASRSAHNPRGLPERTIEELKLLEFGPVTFPAYDGATAGLRSLTDTFAPRPRRRPARRLPPRPDKYDYNDKPSWYLR